MNLTSASPELPLTLSQLLDSTVACDSLTGAGMSASAAIAKGKLFASCAAKLIEAGRSPGEAAIAVFVPGRIEVLGKHTDYCGGRSLLCTVEKGLCFVASAKAGPATRFFAVDLGGSANLSPDCDSASAMGHWSNYPLTIVRRIARNFPGADIGADVAMASDLPPASGLSSSSAMMIGTFLVLAAINRIAGRGEYTAEIKTLEDLAAYLGCCENGQSFGSLTGDQGVGTFGGSQDHTAILCCKPKRLSVYSFCPVQHERDITLPDDWRFVIAASGVIAEKTGDARLRYNAVSLRARRLVELWNGSGEKRVDCLRQIIDSSPSALASLQEILNANAQLDRELRLSQRLNQFLSESNSYIPRAVLAIESGQREPLRQIIDQSQSDAKALLKNQIPETVDLQRRLIGLGAIAASSFGAGFGGSVWGLSDRQHLQPLMEAMSSAGVQCFATVPSCGATRIAVPRDAG